MFIETTNTIDSIARVTEYWDGSRITHFEITQLGEDYAVCIRVFGGSSPLFISGPIPYTGIGDTRAYHREILRMVARTLTEQSVITIDDVNGIIRDAADILA